MAKYMVKIVKPVTDYLTGEIEVEADNEAAAIALAYDAVEQDRVNFEYWMESPNGSMEEITYEASPVMSEDELLAALKAGEPDAGC